MAGSINMTELKLVAVSRSILTYAAPYTGKVNRDHAQHSLREHYARIRRAFVQRLKITERSVAGLGISIDGNYVILQQWTGRE